MWVILFGALFSMGLGYRLGYVDAKCKYKGSKVKEFKHTPTPTAPPSEYFETPQFEIPQFK